VNRRKAAIGYVTYLVAKEVARRSLRKRYERAATPRRTRAAGLLVAAGATAATVVAVRRIGRPGS
jgi:hypothetical protein